MLDRQPNVRPFDAGGDPMRVRDEIIVSCRLLVEAKWKRRMRGLVAPMVGFALGARQIGEGFQWGLPARISGASIGRYAFVGPNCNLAGPTIIGDLTMISAEVAIVGDDHTFTDPNVPTRYNFPTRPRPTTIIEADCWVGRRVILKEGIVLARGTIVAAGAVVTRSTEPYSVVAGVPARLIRHRFDKDEQRQHDDLLYGDGTQ